MNGLLKKNEGYKSINSSQVITTNTNTNNSSTSSIQK
jgi:hypothetical protein